MTSKEVFNLQTFLGELRDFIINHDCDICGDSGHPCEMIKKLQWVLGKLEGFEKQLLADLATNVDLTDKEITEFLAHEDNHGKIYSLGLEQGRRKRNKEIMGIE